MIFILCLYKQLLLSQSEPVYVPIKFERDIEKTSGTESDDSASKFNINIIAGKY